MSRGGEGTKGPGESVTGKVLGVPGWTAGSIEGDLLTPYRGTAGPEGNEEFWAHTRVLTPVPCTGSFIDNSQDSRRSWKTKITDRKELGGI